MKKIITIIIAAAAVIFFTLFLFIKLYVTPEKVREFLVSYAEESLNRKITVGEIKINLFEGIDIKDFAVKEADQSSDFVKCRDFILKFQLFPLLSRKIVIDEISLVSPELKIARDDKGIFNFEGLRKKEAPEEAREEARREKKAAEAKRLPISLLVNNISVRDLKFSFADATKALPDMKGTLGVNAGIRSETRSLLSSKGDVDLTIDEADLRGPSKRQIKNLSASLDYAAEIDPEEGNIRIGKAAFKIQGIPVSVTGDVWAFRKEPKVDITVSVPKVKTADLMKAASAFADLKGLTLSGNVSADINLKGFLKKTESLKADGLITLDQAGVSYKNINTVLDGALKLSEQKVNVDIKGAAGKNAAQIKGSVSNYFKEPDIKLDLHSKQLYLDELIPAKTEKTSAETKTKGSGASKAGKSPSKKPVEPEPVALKLRAGGEIRIDSAIYDGMTMSDFYMMYKLRDNKFEIINLSAVMGKGRINADSVIDLSKKGYGYSLTCRADSIHADEIVTALFPKAADTVFGSLSFNLKMDGAGVLPDDIRKNLLADGDFDIKDGRLENSALTYNLSRFLDLDELKTINLTQAKGTVKIKDRVAHLKSVFASDDIEMNPSGDIGLDESLDLAFDLRLSPRLTQKTVGGDIGKYLKDEQGWGSVPLVVTGTLSDPSYKVDVAKAGKKVFDREINKFLDRLFKKK